MIPVILIIIGLIGGLAFITGFLSNDYSILTDSNFMFFIIILFLIYGLTNIIKR